MLGGVATAIASLADGESDEEGATEEEFIRWLCKDLLDREYKAHEIEQLDLIFYFNMLADANKLEGNKTGKKESLLFF